MLTEMRDTVGLMMLLTGDDPSTATFDERQRGLRDDRAGEGRRQIRQFTGNDYMDDLASGNFAACIGWSGDISQLALDNPDLQLRHPRGGRDAVVATRW